MCDQLLRLVEKNLAYHQLIIMHIINKFLKFNVMYRWELTIS
jgi:hypothetical protein